MVRKADVKAVENLGGGKGTAYVHHIISKEEMLGHGRLYARVVLPPGSSVGWHQHVRDTEPYYILKGEMCIRDRPWRPQRLFGVTKDKTEKGCLSNRSILCIL